MTYLDRHPRPDQAAGPAVAVVPRWVLDDPRAIPSPPPKLGRRRCDDWTVTPVVLDGVEAVGLACRRCGVALELHQPEVSLPDQTLGTCPGCGAWHLIAEGAEGRRILMVEFPVAADPR